MANNHFSNVIAPSDGVRRLLCETAVLFLGLAAILYCFFAYRMNAFEYHILGSSVRSTLLYAAYVMVPLGILTAGAFSRMKQLGDAFGMISLIVTSLGMILLFLNSIASLKYERNLEGILGSGLEFLTFAVAVAVFVNLTMSCMEFRTVPALGIVGAICALLAMLLTVIRTVEAFSAFSFTWDFAWNKDFDWSNLPSEVESNHLTYHAKWIFRNIKMNHPDELEKMFLLRLLERLSACVLYGIFAFFFLRYYNEMKKFNKLMEHAGEYVEIPTMRIADSLAKTEQVISDKLKNGGDSVKMRLRKLNDMTKAKEEGLDITVMSDEWDRERRRSLEDDSDEERPRRRRSVEDDFEEERPRRRRRPVEKEEDELTEEERYLMEERRKRNPNQEEEREQRRAKRASRRRDDDYRQRRRDRLESRESDMEKSMNDYYDNYMQVREERISKNNARRM